MLRLGEKRAIRARVARRLVRFVKGLAQIERLLGGKAELVRGGQLNVSKRESLRLSNLLRRARAADDGGLADGLQSLLQRSRDAAIDQALLFVDSRLRLPRLPDGSKGFIAAKAGLDDEIRHRLEMTDCCITLRDQCERRRLHAADGDEFLLALRLLRQCIGARQVHAEQPVGTGAP